MKIICSKEILLNNINVVLKAVPSRTARPIQECILITADNKGFRLTANDEKELGIETLNIDSQIMEEGCVAIKARIFSEIIRNMPEDEVIISSNNNIVTIRCGKSEFKISSEPGDEFVKLPEIEKKSKVEISQLKLKNMIRQTIFSVAIDDSRKFLTGELIEVKENNINIVAIDGNRISFRTSKIDSYEQDIKVIVPAKTLGEISKIINEKEDKNILLYIDKNHILFELESCIVMSRLIDNEYLNYNQFFNEDDTNTTIEINKNELLKAIERASLSVSSTKNPVKLTIENNKLIITSNTELVNSYEEVKIVTDGKDLKIAFNPKFIIDALRAIEDETILIKFINPLSPCIIKNTENKNYKYLIVPIRLRD